MSRMLDSTLVLCDLDSLLLDKDGSLDAIVRDVLRLYLSRGGKFTVFSQRTPRAVRALLNGVSLSAPALLCGGTLVYRFADGTSQPLRTFEGFGASFLSKLPGAAGVGIALQMKDGATRVLRMSKGLERHLRREYTPYLLNSAGDVACADVLRMLLYQDERSLPLAQMLSKALGESASRLRVERIAPDTLALTPGAVSGAAMLSAVCLPLMLPAERVLVMAGSQMMLEPVRAASRSAAAADAPAEVRLAAQKLTLTDCANGAAAEFLYGLVRAAEKAG